ncbi:GNAT family N-acetyltransferase [Streptococcus suis]|uniref:Histone acetyltransferase HPA2-like acetyltransferase n=1 Tax=Streptococcus suis TaxID=1307 RepID=A0A116K6E9_STRSU|nr:GNAT family N-acetyltransferase [Streptococcus suis]MBS8025425.1 GNAT family N-acetyltransferase [Streptococcus suis]MBS8085091.1 GNAT family N-acetyltransferase [Streptococcus suis]MCH1637301.1 GNAT family N-acetyltransferase [Streptococcus suis]MCH1648058.1 GNAT family N-acetyltransferase [Streptococcus suis]MCL4898171.1 GNAT family N-acetyltransferase [Streptococcus suis]
MEIRFATPSDLEQVVLIENANFSKEERIAESVLAIYLNALSKTCLIMEHDGEIAGYLLSCPSVSQTVTDDIFYLTESDMPTGGHLAIASLSVADTYKGQGVGTLLLAAIKEVALARGFEGIALTCKEYLIGYYEMNQFEDFGPSLSQFGGQMWSDMYWKAL